MEQEIKKKMVASEEVYQKNQRVLEESLDVIAEEKRDFFQYLDNTAEQLRFISHREVYEQSQDMGSGYRIIEQAQEEAEYILKNASRTLEDRLEANQINYRKEQHAFEDELYSLKKEEE